MNIDSQEMIQVTAAGEGAATPRFDMYATIHKALRALMADTLLAVGRADTDDALELAQTCQRVMELLDICASHLKHENDFVHPALEMGRPGSSGQIAGEHEEHFRHIAALRDQTAALLKAPESARAPATLSLYRALSRFMAENFEHMLYEETTHNALLWAAYSDTELLAINDALVASIPPEEMMAIVRWMVPFMNPAERLAMMGGMKAHAPAPAFAAVLDTVRPHLSDVEWGKLTRGLGVPAVPGLVHA